MVPFTICRNLLGLELSKSLHCQIKLQFQLFTACLRKGSTDQGQGATLAPGVWSAALGREKRGRDNLPFKKSFKVLCCGLNTP